MRGGLGVRGELFEKMHCRRGKKWNESGFRPPLCTYRLNWARRTSWGWWDDWDDTVFQTQDSKFVPWRSEAEHATSRSRRLPTILTFKRGWERNIFCFFQTAETGNRNPNSGVKGNEMKWNESGFRPPLCTYRLNWARRTSWGPNRARARGSVPGLGGLKETKKFLPHPRVKVSIVGSLRDREVACSASDRQGSNFESCVWRTVSSQSSHHPQEVLPKVA